MTVGGKIGVLVVDDSAMFRALLSQVLNAEPDIEVIGAVANAAEARNFMSRRRPDIITLDLEMPGEDGLSLLRDYMKRRPIPTIVVSSRTRSGVRITLEALDAGAVDVVAKPFGNTRELLSQSLEPVCRSVRAAHASGFRRPGRSSVSAAPDGLGRPDNGYWSQVDDWPILIGCSTGGVQALGSILPTLPANSPPVVIVQHMPEGFTGAFARRLNGLCEVTVTEAQGNEKLRRGHVLIAPGGTRHLVISRAGVEVRTELVEAEPVCFSRPSVDVLFTSAARVLGARQSAAILTGMGSDGALGLAAIRRSGGRTFAQDEASSEIFGMPARAHEIGASEALVPLSKMVTTLLASVGVARDVTV